MQAQVRKLFSNHIFLIFFGILVGMFIILGIRFVAYKAEDIHYHANFVLYINGQREEFKNPRYYTEVNLCTADNAMIPATRVHMHDGINDVIHVEASSVTWGAFFENLGWTFGPTAIITPDGTVYSEYGDNKLNLTLNGLDYTDMGGLANTVIRDKDRLLISYGNIDRAVLSSEYNSVASNAQKYDLSKDPKSCGSHDSATMKTKFEHMF